MATCQTLSRISVFELCEICIYMQIHAGIYPNFSTNVRFVAEDELKEEQL